MRLEDSEEDFLEKGDAIIRYTFKEKPPEDMEEWAKVYNQAVYIEMWRLRNIAELFRG
ncbi:MAG: hypothetical protein MJZ27_09950 [Bacteroidales bacterium]|nr:hypothetical protein [Bacteroidales bacterium]